MSPSRRPSRLNRTAPTTDARWRTARLLASGSLTIVTAALSLLNVTPGFSSSLVADINQTGNPTVGLLDGAVFRAGGKLLFTGDNGLTQAEPWISDGTAMGTERLPTTQFINTKNVMNDVVIMGGEAYFVGTNSQGYCELWKSDLTVGNVVQVTTLGVPGGTSCPQQPTVAGSFIYFHRTGPNSVGDYGKEMWRTDGSPGNQTVIELLPGPDGPFFIGNLTAVSDDLYFNADEGITGIELWRITAAGGIDRIDAIDNGGTPTEDFSLVTSLFRFNANSLVFSANDPVNGTELWRTNGVTSVRVDINAGGANSLPNNFVKLGGSVYFRATRVGEGQELWGYDGTNATLVKDLQAGPNSSSIQLLSKFNGALYFIPQDGTGFDLWTSDGTEAGTVKVHDLPLTGAEEFLELEAGTTQFWFILDRNTGAEPIELWRSDGTDAGTLLLKTFPDYESNSAVALNDVLFLNATTDAGGSELWKSDGTVLGTEAVTAHAEPGSNPEDLIAVGDSVAFLANDVTNAHQIWFSEGATANTALRLDANPDGNTLTQLRGAAFNGLIYFTADASPAGEEVWRIDANTASLAFDVLPSDDNSPSDYYAGPNHLFWSGYDDDGDYDAWASDGTSLVAVDTAPGSSDDVAEAIFFDGWTYLSAQSPASGQELMRSNGLTGGTELFLDIHPTGSSQPERFGVGLGLLFFSALDGQGREPWVSDGTVAGTTQLLDIGAGALGSSPDNFVESNGLVFFTASQAGTTSLFVTDGTSAGTELLEPDIAGPIASVQTGVVFLKDDGISGKELHFSDGVLSMLIKDINPGSNGSSASVLVQFNDVAYFTANDGIHGQELWTTDGTAQGTRLALDVHPGPLGSGIKMADLAVGDNVLYFSANDGVTGVELHRFEPPLFSDGFESGDTTLWSSANP